MRKPFVVEVNGRTVMRKDLQENPQVYVRAAQRGASQTLEMRLVREEKPPCSTEELLSRTIWVAPVPSKTYNLVELERKELEELLSYVRTHGADLMKDCKEKHNQHYQDAAAFFEHVVKPSIFWRLAEELLETMKEEVPV